MIRLMGSIFVFAAGGCVWYLRRRERQERGRILSDLTAALAEMETAIRLERTSLPMLLTRLAEGREPKNAALFLAAARSLRAGTPCLTAWRQAAEDLPLPEGDKQALSHLAEAWTGDEIGICKAITLACEKLQSSLKKFEKESAAEEKLMTALCFSTSALLVILLI